MDTLEATTPLRFKNQSGLIDPELLASKQFLIIGAGAIGSFFATTLAKMGASKVTVFDDDKVEEHNIANQMYPTYMVEVPKVDALSDVVKAYSDVVIEARNERFDSNSLAGVDFVISAVDNMDTRKKIFEECKKQMSTGFFVDGRMSAMAMRAYCVNMEDKEQVRFYETTLYPQSKAAPERCTAKSVIYTVLLVAGIMLNLVKKAINKEKYPVETYFDCNANTFSSY